MWLRRVPGVRVVREGLAALVATAASGEWEVGDSCAAVAAGRAAPAGGGPPGGGGGGGKGGGGTGVGGGGATTPAPPGGEWGGKRVYCGWAGAGGAPRP